MKTRLKDTIKSATDQIDVLAKMYPMKALAIDLRGADDPRAESTLRAELNGQPGYKLGGSTFVAIMDLATKHPDHRVREMALAALDTIEAHFGRVAYQVPVIEHQGDPLPVLAHVARISKEFSEAVNAASDAMADGRVDAHEAVLMRAEAVELRDAIIRMIAMLDHLPVACALRRAK